ncbi:MAG TPA: corrinoid protein [Thermoleophilia bacterium]|nr:corrinoid protein [Thermoleophilia bacterium]
MADFESLKQMIINGDDAATAASQQLIDGGASARDILNEALLPGMDVVGDEMKTGEKFIPEVLLSARIMQACLDIIKPHLAAGESMSLGTVVIGTVEGDMHDIGKNLAAMLLSGAGFEVVNLGKGVTPADFVAAVKEHKPQIVGMSGLLTTTIPKMPETIQALKDAGLRDSVKVIIGGAPVSVEWANEIGADAYGANASLGVTKCKELVS